MGWDETDLLRQEVACDDGAAGWRFAGREDRLGGIEAHALVQDGGEEGHGGGGDGVEGDVLFRRARAREFLAQQRADIRVAGEEEDAAGHGGGGRLGAGHDEQAAVGVDLAAAELLVGVGVPEDAGEEVAALRDRCEAPVDLGDRERLVVAQFLEQRGRHQPLQERVRDRELLDGADDGPGLHAVEDQRHPRVVVAGREAAEGLAEGEVPDDVEGGPVEPLRHVDGAGGAGLAQAADEQVDVGLDEGLLVVDGAVGEGGGEDAAEAGVVVLVGGQDLGRAVDAEVLGVASRILDEGRLVGFARVDVRPGVRVDEGDAAGRHAHDIAVAGVQRRELVDQHAADVGALVGNA